MRHVFQALARRHIRHLITLILIDALVFGATNSKTVPSLMLMIGYVLLMATTYQLIYVLLSVLRLYGLKFKKQRRLSLYITVVAGILVALQSTGELSARDTIVLLPLAAIAYVYSSYGAEQAV